MARLSLLLLAAVVGVLFSHAAGIHTLDPVRPEAGTGHGDGTKVNGLVGVCIICFQLLA
jgi:UPF0716 family protein affecting phage T7 exclusion